MNRIYLPRTTESHMCKPLVRGLLISSALILIMVAFSLRLVRGVLFAQDFKGLREEMVKYQIEARGIKERCVLDAMRKVERHKFVPLNLQYLAYEDMPLSIGSGQTISQPYIVALMTELLELKGNEKVLEIGTGSGYQAAILSELAKDVYTIEILPELANRSQKLLTGLGYTNIKVKCDDGYLGWPEFAPFDAIIVTCAPYETPQTLIEQLVEGGRMVIPVGKNYQELKLLIKIKGKIEQTSIIPVRFVPMIRKDKLSVRTYPTPSQHKKMAMVFWVWG